MSNFGSTSTSDTFTGGLQTYGGGYNNAKDFYIYRRGRPTTEVDL